MENKNEKIKCWACLSNKIGFFTGKEGFNIYRCHNCELLFLWPVPDSRSIYNQDYFMGADMGYGFIDYDEDKKAMIPTFNKYLDLIEKATGRKGRLLDVGAATGFFMQLAEKRGWRTSGVEISEYAAKIGQGRGLDIKNGILEDAEFSVDTFDVITMWDVVEHFTDPALTLKKARKLLAPGGVLAINTPDGGSLWAGLMKSWWHALIPPEHINIFNKKSLELILSQNGFRLIIIAKIGKSFSLPYVLKITHKWLGIKLIDKFADICDTEFLRRFSIPINLRDNIFIIATPVHNESKKS